MSFMILGPDDWHQFQQELFERLNTMGEAMSAHTEALNEVRTNLTEAATEIVGKLDQLNQDALSDEDKATLANIREQAAALADVVPDVPVEEPVDEEGEDGPLVTEPNA